MRHACDCPRKLSALHSRPLNGSFKSSCAVTKDQADLRVANQKHVLQVMSLTHGNLAKQSQTTVTQADLATAPRACGAVYDC